MKKTVIILLAVLPIVLIFVIAFSGRILSLYTHISVERVVFVNSERQEYGEDELFTLEVGEERACLIRIYPELATDQAVSYTSADEDVCRVDENGVITGVARGSTTVIVKTKDGGKTASLPVVVTADRVTGVTLPVSELSLKVGEFYTLSAAVVPQTALNKRVTYQSSSPTVCTVDGNGTLRAIAAGEAVITVTTAEGGKSVSCRVTVSAGVPPLSFDFPPALGLTAGAGGYITTQSYLRLSEYLVVDEERIDATEVRFAVISGGAVATVTEGGELSFKSSGIVTLRVYVGDPDAPRYYLDVRFAMLGS